MTKKLIIHCKKTYVPPYGVIKWDCNPKAPSPRKKYGNMGFGITLHCMGSGGGKDRLPLFTFVANLELLRTIASLFDPWAPTFMYKNFDLASTTAINTTLKNFL